MRNWTGNHNDQPEIGNGITMLRNVSFITNGQATRRPQLGDKLTLSASLLSSLNPRQGGNYLIAADGSGKLVSVNMSDGTSTDVATGLNADIKGCFAQHQQNTYYTNDFDNVLRVNDGVSTAVEAGITGPSATPTISTYGGVLFYTTAVVSASPIVTGTGFESITAGSKIGIANSAGTYVIYTVSSVSSNGTSLNLDSNWGSAANTAASTRILPTKTLSTGLHSVRYRYKDKKTGYVSNPSPIVNTSTATLTYAPGIDVVASSDSKVDGIIIEFTTVNGSEYYQSIIVPNTSNCYAINGSDTTLASGISIDSYYGAFGHEKPPCYELLCEHRGRLFGFKHAVRTNTAASVALSAASVSGTGFSQNWVGRLATFAGSSSTSYVIQSVSSSNTSLTLASNFTGSTSTAATMYVYHPTSDMLAWSRAGFPESWKPSTWARRVLNNGDEPSALFSAYDTLWVAGQHSLKAFDYTSDPAAARISTIPTQLGIYNQRCIVNAEGRIFCFGAAGVFEMRGRIPTQISGAIDQDVENLIDRSQKEAFHATYDFYEDAVIFFFCRSGDTVCKDAIAYHLPSKQWQMRTWRQGIKCSHISWTGSQAARPYLGCENGFTWRITHDLKGDGIPSSLTTGVVTVAAGATTTSIPVDEALPTGSETLNGVMLYNPSTGTAKAITSNTSSTITCAAFSAAPAAGTELYLGSIDTYMQSEWWYGPSLHAMKRPSYLMLEHMSDTTACVAKVQIKEGLSDTALTWTKSSGDSMLSGITYDNNGDTATVDFNYRSGVIYLNLFDKWSPYWRWEITQERPEGDFKLLDAKFLLQNKQEIDSNIKPT